MDIAFSMLERRVPEPPQKIIEIVHVEVELSMTREERTPLVVFITRKRLKIIGGQTMDKTTSSSRNI